MKQMSFQIFWSVFPWGVGGLSSLSVRGGGQAECPPGVVGGKKNNKARRASGDPQTSLTSPIIIKAMLGCLLNLHNTILTLLLQLSITGGTRPSPLCLLSSLLIGPGVYLSKHKRLIPCCFAPLCSADMNFHRMMKHRAG